MAECIRTVNCKMAPTQEQMSEIEDTLKAFTDACIWINSNVDARIRNRVIIHHFAYKDVRAKFGLSANLAVNAITRVAGNRKTAHLNGSDVVEFKPTSVSYDARIFAFRELDEMVSLTLLRSRQRIKLVLSDYQKDRLKGSRPTSATLCKKGREYYINIQIKSEAPEPIHTNKVLGVDLGITDIAMTSEGQSFAGEAIKDIKNHYASVRQSVQQAVSKGTRSCRRRGRQLLNRLSGKESRYQKQINHEISKAIVARAQKMPAMVALEDLTGIRVGVNKKAGKDQRRKINGWAFYQLREFLTYKALAVGVPLVLVDPAYTSQTCHKCGRHGIRKGKKFSCPHCGWSGDADFNGANMIALIGLHVGQPRGPMLPMFQAASGLLKARSI